MFVNEDAPGKIMAQALQELAEKNLEDTDGRWLEALTVRVAPHIRDWDIAQCWLWMDWPDRVRLFPQSTKLDVGIDVVAQRGNGQLIAIQCKARQLDEQGHGSTIGLDEVSHFAAASSNDSWAERWLVTNGDNRLASGAGQLSAMADKPLKLINITHDCRQQQQSDSTDEPGQQPDPQNGQSKTDMQREAVDTAVRLLRSHEVSNSDNGLPKGEARGRIILPCGTGKTRISLQIIEKLTPANQLSIVLCPSIALVAQIRREYLQHKTVDLDILAVCSDETAGYDPKKEGSRNATIDPTVDNSNISADEVKGQVTTDSDEIAQWIKKPVSDGIKVLIGTYQSSHKVSKALLDSGTKARVLIADEAHRTAGLKRKKSGNTYKDEGRLRDFTVCHDSQKFPVTYRVYQTATPRIYDTTQSTGNPDWVVRSMDDEETFGVELYRKSYQEAVINGWLSDYRIIALGINDPEAYETANQLARDTKSKGKSRLTSSGYLRGLALALVMGGATQGDEEADIRSCIAFMNTVDKSKNMAKDLQTRAVKNWVRNWLADHAAGKAMADYTLEHLDATSRVTARDQARARLATATAGQHYGIINVGIFGEGTDSPSLSAVAFLEPRKSPVDVVQAVGRAMRTAPGKKLGYIICPILIPPDADPETWLSTSDMDEGWQELGQILLALRAHDSRIEDKLSTLMQLYLPMAPEQERTIVAVARQEDKRIQYGEVTGAPGDAGQAVKKVLKEGKTFPEAGITPIHEPTTHADPASEEKASTDHPNIQSDQIKAHDKRPEPNQLITGKKNADGSLELRTDSVVRDKPKPDEARGPVNIKKTKDKARKTINKGEGGIRLNPDKPRKPRKTKAEYAEEKGQLMLKLSGMQEHGQAIKMNLLKKSGLTGNRIERDLNLLESSVSEAARHLRADGLLEHMNHHFGLGQLIKNKDDKKTTVSADGCTIAALLMMNGCMLHQRIAQGQWLGGIANLDTLKSHTQVIRQISRAWETILRHDFRPVLEPPLEAIYSLEESGKTAGLERALHHLAAEAQRIAKTYADMGADHAGPLFNKVMGNQASDGAFFTRPVAASLAARLTLDVLDDQANWRNPQTWRMNKTIDLACGSGTLLAAMLTGMKRRASDAGATDQERAELHALGVEETIKGLDINPVSLQLAAMQLTASSHDIRYRKMGLWQMPYGPDKNNASKVAAGTLELLGQSAIVSHENTRQPKLPMPLPDPDIAARATWGEDNNPRPGEQHACVDTAPAELEEAIAAARNVRVVIMNPPFTNRARMGEKFPKAIQSQLGSVVTRFQPTS